MDFKMDTEIKSVAQPPRLQPFRVHEKMEMEIEHSQEQDIIKKVHEPKGWVSPPVVNPKKLRSKRDATGRGHASWQIKPYPADLSNIQP